MSFHIESNKSIPVGIQELTSLQTSGLQAVQAWKLYQNGFITSNYFRGSPFLIVPSSIPYHRPWATWKHSNFWKFPNCPKLQRICKKRTSMGFAHIPHLYVDRKRLRHWLKICQANSHSTFTTLLISVQDLRTWDFSYFLIIHFIIKKWNEHKHLYWRKNSRINIQKWVIFYFFFDSLQISFHSIVHVILHAICHNFVDHLCI